MGRPFQASLVAGDGKIYFTNLDGGIAVVKASPKFQILARNGLGEAIVASPAISNGQIFIRGEKHLFCIQGSKGSK
jgi:outer membrane protein assembly factor BamB